MSTSTPATPRRRATSRAKPDSPALFQEPPPPATDQAADDPAAGDTDPASDPEAAEEQTTDDTPAEVRTVNGLRIIKVSECLSPVSQRVGRPVPFKGVVLLTLEDGSTVCACAHCEFTGTRGEVQGHVRVVHTPRRGPRRPPPDLAPPLAEVDPVLGALTIREVLDMARDSVHWGALLAEARASAEGWRERALAAEMWRRKATHNLARLGFVYTEDGDSPQ